MTRMVTWHRQDMVSMVAAARLRAESFSFQTTFQ
jgi:hypothetical protein